MDKQTANGPGQGENVIILCERCFVPIGEDESLVREVGPRGPDRNGSARWVHSYRHRDRCTTPRYAAHERPDTGSWDPKRGIGVLRILYGPTT